MMLVKTEVRPSKIQGLGLFALEPISSGTEVWKYVEGFDHEIKDWSNLPQVALDFLEKYAVFQHGYYTMNNDDARFYNHSDAPNTAGDARRNAEIAIKDIEAGEEITCDYREWDDDSWFLTTGTVAGETTD
jgi:uncharacterized protein